MQKFSLGLTLCAVLTLTACVSESSYVGSDRQVGARSLDNREAARTRISLGLNYLRRGDTTQAKYNLERAKAFAPNMPEVYNALAYYYQSVGEQVQAEDAYKQALNKDSDNADAYNNYGAFLCQVGKYQQAEELLLKAISRPGYIRVAESYENLALCQLDQQGFGKAKTFLESSVSHNGTRISSLINLAALTYAMGDNVAAKNALQRIQRLGRVSARSTLLNYLVADKQGDMATVKHAEQLLLTLYIDTPEARLLLQQRLQESEFEQLREQYKLSLMANIVLPDTAAVAPGEPVANPRLRVVRRKTSEAVIVEPATATATAPQPAPDSMTASAGQIAAQATTTAGSVSSQAIAGTLALSLPAETVLSAQAGPAVTLTERVNSDAAQPTQADELAADLPALTADDNSAKFHIVQEGESLYSISMLHNIRLPRLMQWNQLTPESLIKTGQQIWLAQVSEDQLLQQKNADRPATANTPVAVTEPYHQVTEGETIFSISYRYNIRLNRFMAWNNFTEQSRLQVGQQVLITDPVSIEP